MSKTQNSDEVFREKLDQLNDFEFNDKVAGVFDDMVRYMKKSKNGLPDILQTKINFLKLIL